jgi:hydroxymethylpyrimidine pyrophosphatase-like HAD family hydrolase
MRYHVLAADYDGTIATHGAVGPSTRAALERLRSSGRRVVLVTGRELDELLEIFKGIEVCDLVVAENGAVLYEPPTGRTDILCAAPTPEFVADLRGRLGRMSVGRAIVATWRPHEGALLDAIRRHGLELQVIFNKDAVMVLPSGVNKATGLAAALTRLKLSPRNTVAVGDAENDHAMLEMCECGAAVSNSVPALRARADVRLAGDHGAGVEELVAQLLADDLASATESLRRHDIPVGTREDGQAVVALPAFGANVLLAGRAGGGQTAMASELLERIAARGYQFLVADSLGDYGAVAGAVNLGDAWQTPPHEEVRSVLMQDSAVVNLRGTSREEQPRYFAGLLALLQDMRTRLGRPHWVIADEADHVLPAGHPTLPGVQGGVLLVTGHAGQLAPQALSGTHLALITGRAADEVLALLGGPPPTPRTARVLQDGEVHAWWRESTEPPFVVRTLASSAGRHRFEALSHG